MSWPLLLVALLALLAALVGAVLPRSLLGRLRVWLGLTALAGLGAYGAQSLAPGSPWERWTAGVLLAFLAITFTRTGLVALFDYFLGKRLGVVVPRLTRDVVAGAVYLVVLVLSVQAITGMELKALVATSAVLTLVLGLALQETLGMLFAGMTLLGDRRLAPGTWVEMDGILGHVEELGWRVLVLRTRLGQRLLVPNTNVTRSPLRVWSANDMGAVVVRLGTSYGASPAKVRELLATVASTIPEVASQPKPQFLLSAFGDSALEWECRLWTSEPWRQADIVDAFLSRAWYALRREGIEIPYPQRVVHQVTRELSPPADLLIAQALGQCPTFASLPAPALEALVRNSRLLMYGDGEVVVREGEASRALYVVAQGKAQVLRGGREVAVLASGELFGEIAFLTGQPRVASVLAQGELLVVAIDASALTQALSEEASLAEELAQRMAERSAELHRLAEMEEAQSTVQLKNTLLARLKRLMGVGAN